MRTSTAITFSCVVLLVAFATGCTGIPEASRDSQKQQARLEIKGSPGTEFSGSCTIGHKQSEQIGGEVPRSFTYDLEGRSLDCQISSGDALRVELTAGNAHSVQSISGGSLHLSYANGSISSVTSSSSRSSRAGSTFSGGKPKEPTGVTRESRDVSDFDEVELRGVGNLSIEQTGSESLSVEAQADVLPKLTTRVVNHRLIIGPTPNTTIHTTEPINYKLTVKDLSAVEVSGAGNVEAEGVSTDSLGVTISGAGDMRMSGKADQQEINVFGSGVYQAGDLESKVVKIYIMGSGSAIVNASEELDVVISGSGSVQYRGDPTVKQDVTGAGRVSKY